MRGWERAFSAALISAFLIAYRSDSPVQPRRVQSRSAAHKHAVDSPVRQHFWHAINAVHLPSGREKKPNQKYVLKLVGKRKALHHLLLCGNSWEVQLLLTVQPSAA